KDIAGLLGIDYRTLGEFNPGLIRGATPPGDSYRINVPMGYGKIVTARYNDISALNNVAIAPPVISTQYYRVRRGDSIGKISLRYRVSVSSLKRANKIKGSTIRVGQVIAIPGGFKGGYAGTMGSLKSAKSVKHKVRRGDSLTKIAARYGASVSSIKSANRIRGSQIKVGQVLTIPGGKRVSSKNSKTSDVVKYRVKNGDTLWDIASKYDVSVSSIRRWNNLSSSQLASGEQLTIYLE
ncbi:MAG: LysM peptidoglycan-binding domain-containing protein, partial [Thermodesulfobacteriota bacterium]